MHFENLTPHPVALYIGDDPFETVPASGTVARVETIDTRAPGRLPGSPHNAYTRKLGEPVDLPDPKPGVVYLVSAMTREAAPHRADLASPRELVRDSSGTPCGWRGLVVNG